MKGFLIYIGVFALLLLLVWVTGLMLIPFVKRREARGKKTENPYVLSVVFWIVIVAVIEGIMSW